MSARPDLKTLFPLLMRFVCVLNSGLFLSYVVLWTLTALRGEFWKADFTSFYTGWSMVLAGEGGELYDLARQAAAQQEVLAAHSRTLLPFVNPPHFAVLFSPLALLPLEISFHAWTALQALALGALLHSVFRLARQWSPPERILLLVTVVALPMLFRSFMLGALSVLGALVLLRFSLSFLEGKDLECALWLAVGSIKPQYILVPLILLAAHRRWKALGFFLSAMLGVFLSTLLLFGRGIWVSYAELVALFSSLPEKTGVDFGMMINFKGMLYSLPGENKLGTVNALSWAALLLVLAFIVYAARPAPGPSLQDPRLSVALFLALGIFFSPHLYPQDGFLIVAPAVLFYAHLRNATGPPRVFALLAPLLPVLFLTSGFLLGGPPGARVSSLLIVAVILFMARRYAAASPFTPAP